MVIPPPVVNPSFKRRGLQRGGIPDNAEIFAHDKKIKNREQKAMPRAPTKKKIEESLRNQLKAKGAEVAHFEDLILDYLTFWDTKKLLKEDINKRGVCYETKSASGYPITKQNQSVKDLVAVNKQMLTILDKMHLTTDEPTGGESGDDDL